MQERVYLIETAEAQQVQDSLWIECHSDGKFGACHTGHEAETLYGDTLLAQEARHFAMAMGTLELEPLPKINGIATNSMLHFLEKDGYRTLKDVHFQSGQFAVHVEA